MKKSDIILELEKATCKLVGLERRIKDLEERFENFEKSHPLIQEFYLLPGVYGYDYDTTDTVKISPHSPIKIY